MKLFSKRRVCIAALLLGTLTAWFLASTLWWKPWIPELHYLRSVLRLVLNSPTTLTELGLLDGTGLDYYSDDLDDLSMRSLTLEQESVAADLKVLRSYDRRKLRDPLTHEVVEWFLDDHKRGHRFAYHNYPVNQLFGVQTRLPEVLLNLHPLRSEGNAEDYLTRVSQFPLAFEQVLEGLLHRQEIGVVLPTFIIERVLRDLRQFLEPEAADHELFTHFAAETKELEGLDSARREEMLSELVSLLEQKVYPAYSSLIEFLERQADVATEEAGVWKLPDGDLYYAYLLRRQTTTDLTADEVHGLGLREVAKLEAEMRELLEGEGYEVVSIGASMRDLSREERFLFPDSSEGRAEMLESYRQMIAEAEASTASLFDLRPELGVKVEAIPSYREAGAPQAYYEPGSLDGTRPGTFYANLRSIAETPTFSMRTLAFHEAIPGHHFQIGIHLAPGRLPFVRKIMPFVRPFNAYLEGWAHYAERLAAENGLLPTSFDRLGFLQGEMLRAVRLVVDTGIHARRWDRAKALEFMREKTGMPEADLLAEVDRYVVYPAQACSYKVGQMKFLELRQRATERLGEDFDLRRFHNVVLGSGVVPLAILEQVVNEWIEREATQPQG